MSGPESGSHQTLRRWIRTSSTRAPCDGTSHRFAGASAVKQRSAGRPPPMARPRSEVQRGFREARRRHASTHREMRCSAAVQAARYRAAFIRRSTAGEMLSELRLAPDMLTFATIGAAM